MNPSYRLAVPILLPEAISVVAQYATGLGYNFLPHTLTSPVQLPFLFHTQNAYNMLPPIELPTQEFLNSNRVLSHHWYHLFPITYMPATSDISTTCHEIESLLITPPISMCQIFLKLLTSSDAYQIFMDSSHLLYIFIRAPTSPFTSIFQCIPCIVCLVTLNYNLYFIDYHP